MYFAILGGSYFQLGLYLAVRNMGFKVIVIDKNDDCYVYKNYPVDVYIGESVRDYPAIISKLKHFDVVGAATVQSDYGVISVARIKEYFKIGNSQVKAATILSNKYEFSNFLAELGLIKEKSLLVNELNFKSLNINWDVPKVIKPVDSSGSRGVYFVNNQNSLENVIDNVLSFSAEKNAVLERQIYGEEMGAQVIVGPKGEIIVLNHNDIIFKSIPVAHGLLETNELLNTQLRRIVNRLNLSNVILNVDYFQTSNSIHMLEIGLRLGATELDQLVSNAIGFSVYDLIVDPSKFNIINSTLEASKEKTYGVLFSPFDSILELKKCESGIVYEIEYDGLKVSYSFDPEISRVEPLQNGTKRIGKFESTGNIKNIETLMKKIIFNHV